MACLMDRKREVSPTSSAQVSAVIGPTPGMVLSRLSLSASSGSWSSDRSRVVSSLIDRSMCSRQSLSSGRMLSATSSLVASSQRSSPSGAAAACCSSRRSPSADPILDFWSAPSVSPADAGSAAPAAGSGSRWRPCGTPAGNRSAGSQRSCRRRSGRSSVSPRRWPAASAGAPPSLASACGSRWS